MMVSFAIYVYREFLSENTNISNNYTKKIFTWNVNKHADYDYSIFNHCLTAEKVNIITTVTRTQWKTFAAIREETKWK